MVRLVDNGWYKIWFDDVLDTFGDDGTDDNDEKPDAGLLSILLKSKSGFKNNIFKI